VKGKVVDALPLSVLLAPDEDATIIRGGSEDGSKLRVCPGHAPDCAVVSIQLSTSYSFLGPADVPTPSMFLSSGVTLRRSRRS